MAQTSAGRRSRGSMTSAKRSRATLPPRVIGRSETAGYIGRSATWFASRLGDLYAMGFPKPLPFLDQWDRHAVDRWLDRLGGDVPLSQRDEADAWLRAANG
jgi:hypothetical protein